MKSTFSAWCIIFSFLLLFNACSDRKRTNPLDPQNPETKGKPVGLYIYAEEHRVTLGWKPLSLKGITAINVYKRSQADSEFVRVDQVDPQYNEYMDYSVEYGVKYQYYITVSAGNYESPPSKILSITPGPTYTWVADIQSGYVTKLTHDLSVHLFNFGTVNYPTLVSVSPRERMAWVYSRFSNRLYKVDSRGGMDMVLTNFPDIRDMEVDTTLKDLWISQPYKGKVQRIQSNGVINMVSTVLSHPTAIAIDQFRHRCWLIDEKSRRVVRLTFNGRLGIVAQENFIAPKDIAVNSVTGDLWIADSTRVIKLDYLGAPTGIMSRNFYYARYLAIDSKRNSCWVVDMEPPNHPASLLKLDENGRVLFKLTEFGNPKYIAVNEWDGSCLLADTGYGYSGLWKISPDGSKIEYVDDFILPSCIAIEYH